MLLACRALYVLRVHCCRVPRADAQRGLNQSIRMGYAYFFVHQLNVLTAYMVLLANVLVSLLLILLETAGCGAHTWWLLNSEIARAQRWGQQRPAPEGKLKSFGEAEERSLSPSHSLPSSRPSEASHGAAASRL
mmetsp:Transcript_107603/g.336522  ORF Transcript_107603/g.336522 Transcript_107603/m.336522 type:complete len:134 (-) Transcript_107603:63-464(-)